MWCLIVLVPVFALNLLLLNVSEQHYKIEGDFMMSLSDDKQADVIDAFNTTSRYLDDILNINNVYFDNMVFGAPT